MKKRGFLAAVLILALLFGVFGVSAYAFRGSGVLVVANEIEVIKTGLYGKKLCFSDKDFKSAFAIDDFESITVNELPSSREGTLLLAGRRVREGQTIKRRNIAALVFVPASGEVEHSSFTFTLDGGTRSVCQMKFIDKINYAPESCAPSSASLSLLTQSDISVYGTLEATDPEGDEIEYMIVSYPKSGSLTLTDKSKGSYKYTPTNDFTGYDSFVYVARDEYGNYSETREVSLKIIERMSGVVYKDMTDREEYNAAVAMMAMGVMSGKQLGDDIYFEPELAVSRAEFVAMALKAVGISASAGVSCFDDNADIPDSLVGYVARAQRLGVIDGEFEAGKLTFSPNRTVTVYEAADIMSRLVGSRAEGEEMELVGILDVPVWARPSLSAMVTMGVIDKESAIPTAAVTRADAAEFLYRLVNNS